MATQQQKSKRILVGVDYTKSSLNAVDYAAGLAKQSGATLILFHVYEFPVVHTNAGLYMVDYKAIKRDDLARLEQLKKKTLDKHPGLQLEIGNSNMSFKAYVEELAAKKKIHVVVLGLETKGKISKFIWGTTGVDIAGKIDCPVVIVPESYTKHKYEKVMAAVDYKQDLKRVVIRKAEQFAKDNQMKCNLVHIQTEDELDFGIEAGERRKEAAKWNIELFKAKGFSEGVKKYVSQNKSDLVVLFSRKHSLVYRLFNETNTKTIAFNSNVPVMAVHA
ncbi:MAG: universal stress protein [Bacteroidia bacterium]|jgi:nucleotide-binding universal stress UspA family protein|nr:universal stress protein [Bacteroidia bacterium]